MQKPFIQKFSSGSIALIPLFLSAIVHYSILSHYFIKDDFLHFYDAANTDYFHFVLKPLGGHILSTYYTVFYVFYKLFALHAEFYFALVFITHLLNVFLLFKIIRLFTQSPYLSVFGAALWGMCPFNQGALGWFSVYGQVLTVTLLLWVIYDLARIHGGRILVTKKIVLKWYLLLLAAATSFGIGFAAASSFPVFAWLLLKSDTGRKGISFYLLPLMVLIPAIYLLQHRVAAEYLGYSQGGSLLAAIDPRYWLETIKTLLGLLSAGVSVLLLGPFMAFSHTSAAIGPLGSLAQSTILQLSFMISILFLTGLAWAVVAAPYGRRYQTLSFLMAVCVIYGIIAVGRTWIFVDLQFPLFNRVFEPRYHYAGSLFLSILACFVLNEMKIRMSTHHFIFRFCSIAWIALIFIPSIIAAPQISNHGRQSRTEYTASVADMERQIQQHPPGATVYIENGRLSAIPTLFMKPAIFPGMAALFLITYPENNVDGREVFFIERDQGVIETVSRLKGTRIHDLIVSADLSPLP